jgi:hypothetical protein
LPITDSKDIAMKQIRLRQPAGIEQLHLATAEPRRPAAGEVLMRLMTGTAS